MTFLTLNGVTVRCHSDAVTEDREEVGLDRDRMFDGTLRVSRRGLFRHWVVQTALMSEADANTLLALINTNSPPLTMNGDLVGGLDTAVMPIPGHNDPVQWAGGFKRRLTFELKETGGPLPADTSAVPFAFFRRGVGYLTGAWGDHPIDITGLSAAGSGDTVSVWKDQSGNSRHLIGAVNGNFLNYDSRMVPVRDGDYVHFGVNASGLPTLMQALKTGTTSTQWWSDLAGGPSGAVEIMLSAKAASGAPLADGSNTLLTINGEMYWPKSDGHVYDTAFSALTHDLGSLTATIDFASLNVYNVTGLGSGAAGPLWVGRIGNSILASDDETSEAGTFPSTSGQFTLGTNSLRDEMFVGWVSDLVIFNGQLTSTQRRSWYDYMRRAVADPPLP